MRCPNRKSAGWIGLTPGLGPYRTSGCGFGDFGIWEFPKIGGTLLWGPYNKPTISGSPIFGNSHLGI